MGCHLQKALVECPEHFATPTASAFPALGQRWRIEDMSFDGKDGSSGTSTDSDSSMSADQSMEAMHTALLGRQSARRSETWPQAAFPMNASERSESLPGEQHCDQAQSDLDDSESEIVEQAANISYAFLSDLSLMAENWTPKDLDSGTPKATPSDMPGMISDASYQGMEF